ncbi:MAG: PAS domain-containing protein [Sulfurimonadaceae bacterium]
MRYIIVIALLASHLFSAQDLEKVTLQLQWYHQFQFAGYYIAKEKGFYKEAGLDVEIREVDLSEDIVESVLQQEAHYATGRTSLIVDRSHGKKVVVLAAILQASPIVIVAKERPDIQRIEDFAGKHIDASGTMIDSLSIRALLNEKNITVDPPEHNHLASDIKSLIEDHADAIVVYNTNEPYQLDKMGVKYRLFHPKDYGFSFYSDFLFSSEAEVERHPQRAAAFKIASLKGWEYAFSNIDETVGIILDKYNSHGKTREALTYEANALKKLAYYKTEKVGTVCSQKMQQLYDTYKKIGLLKNDIDLDAFILTDDQSTKAEFTKQERDYLREKKEITVCGQRLWRPYIDFTGEQPQGLFVDLAKEYEKIIGVPLRFVRTKDWAECIARTKEDEIDIAVPIMTKPNHHRHLTPTKPVGKEHLVLVSKVEKPFIPDISEAGNIKVSLCRGSDSYLHYVRANYPNLDLVFVSDLQEGLQSVVEGKTDAHIGTMLPATFEISQRYPKELKINGRFMELELTGSIGVRKSEPILIDIFNKTIDTLDPKTSREIFNNWISVRQEQAFDYSLFWKILFAAVLVLFILVYRQQLLKREHKKLQAAYARIKQQQRKLKEQKTVYELVFNGITDGVLMLENGKFIDCNQPIVKMLKYSKKEEVLNLTPSALSPTYQPDGRLSSEKADEMMALAFKNGVHRFEWIHTKATGEEFWVEITLTPIVIDNKKLLHVVWRDISKRKELEHDNTSLKEQMELAFSGSRDGLWDWDLENDTVYFSPRWKEMLGYRDDELENNLSTWQERVHPDDLEQALKDVQRNREGRSETYENKHRLRHKDGHWVWIYARGKTQFDENGKAIRMIGTHTDLSTEINLTNKLSELNHSLETKIEEAVSGLKKAQEQAKLGSWKLDIETNRLLWSDETYKIFDLPNTSEMATYENFLNAIHPDDRESVNAAYTESLETQEPYEIIHRLLMPDGRIKYVKEHCETSFDADGKALLSVGTIQDITAEQTAVQDLRHKDEMLFRQSRLAQMGEMISMIAHQWRQPLNAISLTTAALELKIEDDKYDKTFFKSRLGRISDYVQHLSSTIEDFRDFFKPDKAKQETTFSEIIDNALSFVRIGLESKNITVQTECNSKESLFSYTNELLQVVMNLIKNAEDALLENKTADPTITIRCYSDEEKATLEVEDNAGGIDDSVIEKIFEPYFTTKDEHNGTGLGLYMSKVIIEDHCDGILSVSNSREGALFKIVLSHA